MTVYELIQELVNYDAESEVRVVATAKSDVEVETIEGFKTDATFDRIGYFDIQDVDKEGKYRTKSDVIISVEY